MAAIALRFASALNLMSGGALHAAALGVQVTGMQLFIYVSASLATAVAVTQAGNIGFIGLLAPHMLRLGGGRDYRVLIPGVMLLGGLLEALFRNGVTLVTTSNVEPSELYRDGLQRAKFLPAIDLLRRHTRVLHLAGSTDFRLRILEQSEIFHHPLDDDADRVMTRAFERMAAECELNHDLEINGRMFHARRRGDGVIWFEFDELGEKPRGAIDYIENTRAFNTVVVSNMPVLNEEDANAARRFITLVDEFYDRNVKLLLSAAAPIPELYTGQKLAFEFERTRSRLTEMQSHDYLARPHLP